MEKAEEPQHAMPREQEQEEDIPALTSMAPCIYVPVTEDFTKPPPELPSDDKERLEQRLREMDEYELGVQKNMHYLFLRENMRNLQFVRRKEQEHDRIYPQPQPARQGLSEEDEEKILGPIVQEKAKLQRILDGPRRPVLPRGPWEVGPNMTSADLLQEQVVSEEWIGQHPREAAAKFTLNTLKAGVHELEGYARFSDEIKERTRQEELVRKTIESSLANKSRAQGGDEKDGDDDEDAAMDIDTEIS